MHIICVQCVVYTHQSVQSESGKELKQTCVVCPTVSQQFLIKTGVKHVKRIHHTVTISCNITVQRASFLFSFYLVVIIQKNVSTFFCELYVRIYINISDSVKCCMPCSQSPKFDFPCVSIMQDASHQNVTSKSI